MALASLAGCTASGNDPDGELDCTSDETWVEQGSVLEGAVGLPTSERAVEEALARFRSRQGGGISLADNRVGSLVVDGREVVVALVSTAPAGGWIVLTVTGCGPYEG